MYKAQLTILDNAYITGMAERNGFERTEHGLGFLLGYTPDADGDVFANRAKLTRNLVPRSRF